MVVVAWLAIALSVWLIDSAVRNRAPIQTIRDVIGSGKLPPVGVSAPASGGSVATTASPTGGNPNTPVSGNVDSWIKQASAILEQNGYSSSQLSYNDIATIIAHESGGDPSAINLYDSNAAAGHPSKGLMQTIDSTFNAWALPGHTNIWNPVDNIIAAVRYAINRYGSLDNVPGVVAVRSGQSYTGY